MRRRSFALDLERPLATARGTIRRREGELVGVDADGVRGVGEATPLPGWTESLDDCRAALDRIDPDATLLDGPPTDPLSAAPGVADALADAPAARHAVESAALDARGRRDGDALASLFADAPADRVPVNATIGDGAVDETVSATKTAVADGFDCLKVKVGVGELDRDVARLRAVREAVGDGVAIRADANGAWDRETASEAVAELAALDLAYLEQPLARTDLAGHAALRGRGVPIALDETLATAGVGAILDADAADVLVLKPMALGGPARTLAVAERVRAAGVDPVVTTTIDAAPARTAAVHVAAAIPDVRPCGLATASALATDLCPDPVPVVGGAIAVPDGPGVAGDAFEDLL
ncbi:o-succinylbenzoate synthase [Haloplanus sp. C73]|uniref:o-succinylbenzoate synthase n=1 Tax=Haloplanus sp. C73 TaxID=3421641 RepID=UPI003EBC5883